MIPSTQHIMKKRHHTQRRLRFMSLILCIIGSVPVTWGIVYMTLSGDLAEIIYIPEQLAPFFAMAGVFILPAIPLWLFDRWLARKLVPMPQSHCPGCGYQLQHLTRPHCPECGLPVPRVFIDTKDASGNNAV